LVPAAVIKSSNDGGPGAPPSPSWRLAGDACGTIFVERHFVPVRPIPSANNAAAGGRWGRSGLDSAFRRGPTVPLTLRLDLLPTSRHRFVCLADGTTGAAGLRENERRHREHSAGQNSTKTHGPASVGCETLTRINGIRHNSPRRDSSTVVRGKILPASSRKPNPEPCCETSLVRRHIALDRTAKRGSLQPPGLAVAVDGFEDGDAGQGKSAANPIPAHR
jgi:hypothetical protein